MKPILIAYATREGHTTTIAARIAESLSALGLETRVHNVADEQSWPDVTDCAAAILASSVHLEKHEAAMERFIVARRDALASIPTAFLSVSLTAHTVQDESRAPEKRAKASAALAKIMDALFAKTGWHPDRTQTVAGALMYSKYNLLIRWVMKGIALKEGGSTDASRDHVYTDWAALDGFVRDFAQAAARPPERT